MLMHMTEKMNYKHSEVLGAVLTNRACHTLAVYFLLNKKMKRLSKEYRVSPLSNTLRDVCLDIGLETPESQIYTSQNDDEQLNEHCYITGQFCNEACFCVFRRCSSRRKRREKNKKVSISRPSGGSTWTSSPSPPSRPPSTWPLARGPARKRNTEQVSRRGPQQQKHILTRQIYKRVYLFLSVFYRVG